MCYNLCVVSITILLFSCVAANEGEFVFLKIDKTISAPNAQLKKAAVEGTVASLQLFHTIFGQIGFSYLFSYNYVKCE